jgi:beta-lactamase class A
MSSVFRPSQNYLSQGTEANSRPSQTSLRRTQAESSSRRELGQQRENKSEIAQKARRRPRNPLISIGFYGLRLFIFGVGISAIAGTILTAINPANQRLTNTQSSLLSKPTESKLTSTTPVSLSPSTANLSVTQEISPLKSKLTALVAKYPQLQAQAFFVNLDNNTYVDMNGDTPIAAASTIKVPILVAFFQDIDAGKIHLDEKLTMKPEWIATGSGDLQYQKPGKVLTALETATKMIIISDNTATNMLIARLGGATALNQRFRSWGLTHTEIKNRLPDLSGTNTTSPKDLANVMRMVEQGKLVSLRSRDRLLEIMQDTRTQTLLPQGLEKGATIAHKTGDIGTVIGDVGLIDMPNGKRYIASVLVKRPYNDSKARTLIQEVSRTTYQHLKFTGKN